MIDQKLSIKTHITDIKKKFNFINMKLFPLRAKKDEKFNLNIFKVLIDPLFNLAWGLLKYNNKSDK